MKQACKASKGKRTVQSEIIGLFPQTQRLVDVQRIRINNHLRAGIYAERPENLLHPEPKHEWIPRILTESLPSYSPLLVASIALEL